MSSSSETGICAICLGNVTPGQAIFTAECSHSFHFGCIGNSVSHGNYLCPICRAKWSTLPFPMPMNPNVPRPQLRTHFPSVPQQQLLPQPAVELEPESLVFSDDEPLPVISTDPAPSASHAGLQSVNIRSVPERAAIGASESVPEFAVLVGIRAPPLFDNARHIERAPIDLVTVLDVSGSMSGSKLNLLKLAVHFVIDNLGPSDRLSIVSFSSGARRIFPLRRMTDNGRQDAKLATDSLQANGLTNIVEGLKKGVQVLEERRQRNPVASIIFLSDGKDTCYRRSLSQNSNPGEAPRQNPEYLHLLPGSICPRNRENQDESHQQTFPVHTFGFGSDHDPVAMHVISDESGGTFSFIESYEMVQDAFASCIGGLLSVVTQELKITVRAASNGVEIKPIPSGRYASEISDQGTQGVINIGDLYADEEKEFLVYLLVPVLQGAEDLENEGRTSLLDIVCSYRDVVSKEMVRVEGDLVEIRRPKVVTPQDMEVNLEVDRQRNRLSVAEGIAEAQRMAESGNLSGACDVLSQRRRRVRNSRAAQAGDVLCNMLESDLRETERRMSSRQIYNCAGRAYALSGMSSHGWQRATTRGSPMLVAEANLDSSSASAQPSNIASPVSLGAYTTPRMAHMVNKSQQLNRSSGATSTPTPTPTPTPPQE